MGCLEPHLFPPAAAHSLREAGEPSQHPVPWQRLGCRSRGSLTHMLGQPSPHFNPSGSVNPAESSVWSVVTLPLPLEGLKNGPRGSGLPFPDEVKHTGAPPSDPPTAPGPENPRSARAARSESLLSPGWAGRQDRSDAHTWSPHQPPVKGRVPHEAGLTADASGSGVPDQRAARPHDPLTFGSSLERLTRPREAPCLPLRFLLQDRTGQGLGGLGHGAQFPRPSPSPGESLLSSSGNKWL